MSQIKEQNKFPKTAPTERDKIFTSQRIQNNCHKDIQ